MVDHSTSKSTNRPKLRLKWGLGCAAIFVLIFLGFAFLMMPALNGTRIKAKRAEAKTEIWSLEAAINAYISNYNRFPVSARLSSSNGVADFTFGTFATSASASGIAN